MPDTHPAPAVNGCGRCRELAGVTYTCPDDSPGDVIAAEADGTIILDDGITTWNPLRALAFLAREALAGDAE